MRDRYIALSTVTYYARNGRLIYSTKFFFFFLKKHIVQGKMDFIFLRETKEEDRVVYPCRNEQCISPPHY